MYQYHYEGHRDFERARLRGVEYVFQISADRKSFMAVSVFVSDDCLEEWQKSHNRTLNSTERYAIAKMSLFQAFDERANPDLMKQEVHVRPADVDGILSTLDLD